MAPSRIELNERALTYIAGELGRYSLLSTDTDAKGMAYEAITSTTLKRERGQFFTPRNVIRMMVEMLDPQPGEKVLDLACGSGGFLVVALSARTPRACSPQMAAHSPSNAVPSELKSGRAEVKKYAGSASMGSMSTPNFAKPRG